MLGLNPAVDRSRCMGGRVPKRSVGVCDWCKRQKKYWEEGAGSKACGKLLMAGIATTR